jgi:exodeoxyribonuclease VII small subunit
MEKENKLSYDEAVQRAEAIIAQLEQAEAISLEEYQRMASEATALLRHCKSLLGEPDSQS